MKLVPLKKVLGRQKNQRKLGLSHEYAVTVTQRPSLEEENEARWNAGETARFVQRAGINNRSRVKKGSRTFDRRPNEEFTTPFVQTISILASVITLLACAWKRKGWPGWTFPFGREGGGGRENRRKARGGYREKGLEKVGRRVEKGGGEPGRAAGGSGREKGRETDRLALYCGTI